MESIQTSKRRKISRPVIVAAAIAFAGTCAIVACGRALKAFTLRDSLSPDTPVLELHVAYKRPNGELISAANAAPQPAATSVSPTSQPTSSAATCPAVVGGDFDTTTPPQPPSNSWEPTPIPCPLVATWNVYRHTVGLSMFIKDGASLADWYENNADFKGFRDSPLWKGFIRQVGVVLKVRAEDLELNDWKGEFLQPLVKEALSADASIHYDVIHGPRGFVFTFSRDKAPMLGRALPILIRTLATSGYQIGEDDFIVEMRVQGSRLYMTQREERVFVGTSLEGLLNVLEEQPFDAPVINGTAAVVVRTEAFFDKVLDSVVGAKAWPVTVSFDLSAQQSMPSEAVFPKARVYQAFAQKTAIGAFAAIPHDALAGIVLSARIPVDQPPTEWKLPGGTADTGGIALVWDIDGASRTSSVGIAVPVPAGLSAELTPDVFLDESAVSATCAGGAVWLGASNDQLLSRMKESCDKQSLSLLDMKGFDASKILPDQQVVMALNTKAAIGELYQLGGGNTPRDGAEPAEIAAQNKLFEEIRQLTDRLAVVGYYGKVEGVEQDLRLKGFSAKTGGV